MLTDSHMIDGDRDGVDMSYGNVTRESFARIEEKLRENRRGEESTSIYKLKNYGLYTV